MPVVVQLADRDVRVGVERKAVLGEAFSYRPGADEFSPAGGSNP
jgi:hypothetical protein